VTSGSAWHDVDVPKTIQIRDVEDDVYDALSQRAAEVGLSVPHFLRREIEQIVARPSVTEWLERTRRRGGTRRPTDTFAALEELRGPWPR
jgi:hypothetical protein